jgi:steroid 5-alpha reductase family enzyme
MPDAAGVLVAKLLGVDLAINVAGWAASLAARTDHLYDATGATAYVTLAAASFAAAPHRGERQAAATAALILWATRLGVFLGTRIARAGGDRRLAPYLHRPGAFLVLWVAQTVWVAAGAAPVVAANAGGVDAPLGARDALVGAAWLGGFALQVVADEQKRAFAADKRNAGRWIATGAWAACRHPNYLGQMVMSWALAAWCAPALPAGGAWAAAALAPAFETWLLLRVSGVPLLEAHADKRWGGDAGYAAYKAATPMLVPRLWRWGGRRPV